LTSVLQDLAAELVMNDERRHAALAGCRVVTLPVAAGPDGPRPPELLIEIARNVLPAVIDISNSLGLLVNDTRRERQALSL
jgi:hypothetical protein